MAKFTYNAIDPSKKTINGTVEAIDRSSAIKALTKQGLRPLSVDATSGEIKKSGFGFFAQKVKNDDLVIFTRQLSAMTSAGVPILRSLSGLMEHAENTALKSMLGDVIHDIESGSTLGDALSKHPKIFSDVYVNMVRAGESAGILDEILKRVAKQQEKNATMRKRIKGAMTYPLVLVSITVLAFFGLMFFVIPQIGNVVKSLGGPEAELPAITQAMLGISGFMRDYWFIVIPVLVAIPMFFRRYIKTDLGKKWWHKTVLHLPIASKIIKKVAVARFSRTFSALMGAGVSVLEALHVTGRAIGNGVYEEVLNEAAEAVKRGEQLSKVIEKNSDLFPSIVAQMLSVGEETGQTETVLLKVADFYEEEVDVAIDSMSAIIEPVMIVFMGAMVGLIAASVMLPLANLSNQIK